MTQKSLIQLVVIDIDGCLNGGVHSAYDLERLELLRRYNERSRREPVYPPVTFCSGRPAPYVQALEQVLDLHVPAVCEHGNMISGVDESRVRMHPDLDPLMPELLMALRRLIAEALPPAERPYYEAGKETHLTIFPAAGMPVERMVAIAAQVIAGQGWNLEARRYGKCAVVTQPGMHKGAGLRWLAEITGIDPARMAGIGDSGPDADFLKLVGFSGAPSNALPEIKNLPVDYIAAEPDIAGVVAFYEECVRRNGGEKK